MTQIRVGSITGSHGIKGGVKVFSYTDPIESIFDYSPWTLRRGTSEQQVVVEGGQNQGKKLVARIEGIDTRNLADALAGYEVYIERDMLPELEEGDFYWLELIGKQVIGADGTHFGEVDHLLETGANDVMVVRATSDSIDDKERLIPFVEGEVVLEVDPQSDKIVVEWQADY